MITLAEINVEREAIKRYKPNQWVAVAAEFYTKVIDAAERDLFATERLAERDRRIAELETQIAELRARASE